MEVKVKEVDGSLPQGSYISVRVGDVQKQTQYNPEKLYRFPEARRYGKVDVYQRVGTCDISWSADEPETKLCKAMGAGGDTGIRLQVCMTRPVGKDLESIDVTTSMAAKNDKKRNGERAKSYLKDHDLESLMTGAMRALLKTMPDDPAAFLCNYISNSKHGNKDSCLASPTTATLQEATDLRRRLAAAESKLLESEIQCGELQRQMQALHGKTCMVTRVNIIDGGHFSSYYRANLLPGAQTDVFSRLHASSGWPVAAGKIRLSNAATGTFSKEVEITAHPDFVVQPTGMSWWSSPSVGTWVMPIPSLQLSRDKKPAKDQEPDEQETARYREVVRDALVSALGDGRLVSAMKMISDTTSAETQSTQLAAHQPSIVKLKHQLCKSLISSVESGTLVKELTRIRQEDLGLPVEAEVARMVEARRVSSQTIKSLTVHQLRIRALETLSQASETGVLAKELQKVFHEKQDSCQPLTLTVHDLRVRALETLSKASETGVLAKELQTVFQTNNESCPSSTLTVHDLRVQALETLSQASATGILAKALQTIFP